MGYYSKEAADRAVRFINNLPHTKGRWSGDLFDLRDWQENEIIRPLFGTLRDDGTRQYRKAYIEIPRKNGKSELCATIALYLLFADNEPGGEIYGAATDRDQASIVFDVAKDMIEMTPALNKRAEIVDYRKRIKVPDTRSVYRAIPADAASSHGFNASGIIFDELHAQPNRDLWDVLTTSTSAREQPLTVAITTAGYDKNSICWEQHSYAKDVQDGVIDDPSFFAYIKAADEEGDDWRDEEVWRRVNPALGDFRSMDEMREKAREAEHIPAQQNTFKRLYLNIWTQQKTKWLDIHAWDKCEEQFTAKDLAGETCYGGLDLASTTDIAAFVLVFPLDRFYVLPYFWLPEESMLERSKKDGVPYDQWVKEGHIYTTPGNVIDYDFIEHTVLELGDEDGFDIEEVGFDPWNSTQVTLNLAEEGATMVQMRQGYKTLGQPTKELEKLVIGAELAHDGNPVLRWMANNVSVKQDPAGNLKPDKSNSQEKIDGIVATVMGLGRAVLREEDSAPKISVI